MKCYIFDVLNGFIDVITNLLTSAKCIPSVSYSIIIIQSKFRRSSFALLKVTWWSGRYNLLPSQDLLNPYFEREATHAIYIIRSVCLNASIICRIDHWDHEKERIVIITDTQLVLVKYNFVASRIDECQRVQLHLVDRVQGGRFTYPNKTMMM